MHFMPAIRWFGKLNRYSMIYTGKNICVKVLFVLCYWGNAQCGSEKKELTKEKKLAKEEGNEKAG